MGARMFRKGLAVAVILLFIGVAFAPSINASVVKDDLVEFEVECCGLGKKHTVQLTQKEAEEVENLIDDIKEKLDDAVTREETVEIFNDAIVELNEFGLLPERMSVKEAQNVVTGYFENELFTKFMERFSREKIVQDNYEIDNLCCMILLDMNNVDVLHGIDFNLFGLFSVLPASIFYILGLIFHSNDSIHDTFVTLAFLVLAYSQIKPLRFFNRINTINVSSIDITSYSLGLLGFKNTSVGNGQEYNVFGFTGFNIIYNYRNEWTPIYDQLFLGFALGARKSLG